MEKPNLSSISTLVGNVLKAGAVTRPRSGKLMQDIRPIPAPLVKICKSCLLPNARKIGRCSYCDTPLNRPSCSPRMALLMVTTSLWLSALLLTSDEVWILPIEEWVLSLQSVTKVIKPPSVPNLQDWLTGLSSQLPSRLPEVTIPDAHKMIQSITPQIVPMPSLPSLPSMSESQQVEKPVSTQVAPKPAAPALTCGGFPAKPNMPEPDFGPYLAQVQQKIRQYWQPPKMDQSKHVVVLYRIACNGKLLQARVQSSSGLPVADQAALTAVRAAAPFPPLPAAYTGNSVDVEFDFDYEMMGQKSQAASGAPKK